MYFMSPSSNVSFTNIPTVSDLLFHLFNTVFQRANVFTLLSPISLFCTYLLLVPG